MEDGMDWQESLMGTRNDPDKVPGVIDVNDMKKVYEPIDITRKTIRLLRLHSRESTECVGTVKHFELNDAPRYLALSYTWDYTSEWTAITVNLVSFALRRDLKSFLLLFQERHPDEWIWIDQICINQQDTTEKNHQVAMMMNIYSQAFEVIIWLSSRLEYDLSRPAQQIREARDDCGYDGPDLELPAFTSHRYWSRAWIVQEILLAAAKTIYWGREVITWEQFSDFVKRASYQEIRKDPRSAKNDSRLKEVIFLALIHEDPALTNPSSLVMHMVNTSCKDPRDLWYGIQGLLHPCWRTEVDYDRDLRRVWLDASVALLKSLQELHEFEVIWCLAKAMGLLTPVRDTFYKSKWPFCDPGSEVWTVLQSLLDEGNQKVEGDLRDLLKPLLCDAISSEEEDRGFFSKAIREIIEESSPDALTPKPEASDRRQRIRKLLRGIEPQNAAREEEGQQLRALSRLRTRLKSALRNATRTQFRRPKKSSKAEENGRQAKCTS